MTNKVQVNGADHHYEQTGYGTPLVFIHGAFADLNIWDPQWKSFAAKYRLLRYDLRGHGKTGASKLDQYTVASYANDLKALLDILEIPSPVICGLSFGGSIAQAFAAQYPDRLRALILAGSAVAIDLTLTDRILCYGLFPKWAMLRTVRALSTKNLTRFSLWLAPLIYGKWWLSQEKKIGETIKQSMLQIKKSEYLKIWAAIYGFHLLPLDKITCPTLVLNGEHESRNAYRHSEAIMRQIPQAVSRVVLGAHHAMNWENSEIFNQFIEEFLEAENFDQIQL